MDTYSHLIRATCFASFASFAVGELRHAKGGESGKRSLGDDF
ncbi:hypothetical protein ACYZTX_00515 [Pseudomonas sp. MDT1-17]